MGTNQFRQRITNERGQTIGYTHSAGNRRIVADDNGNTRGWVVNGKTFNIAGACVSQNEVPGLLLNGNNH
jgi:hypothetical protein